MLVNVAQSVATLSCALFAGAAVYINWAEHPARLECGQALAAAVFGPSYRRAARMQAALALVSTVAATIAALGGGGWAWLLGAALIFSVVPFTVIAIMPTNKQLLAADLDTAAERTGALLRTWGRLHAVRSGLSLVASCLFVYLLSAG